MRERLFGTTELRVSEFGLGCARIGGIFKSEPGQFIDLLSAAFDHGITFYDTADMYSQGESERLVGQAFRGRRASVVIASKVGYALPARRQLIARIKPLVRPLIKLLRIKRENLPSAVRGTVAQNFSPDYIRRAVDASLRRLRTDYLDVLQLHSPPAEIVQRGDWVETLSGLKRAGKVRHYGVSCDTLEAAQAALAVPGVASLQLLVNMLDRRFAEAIVPAAQARGIAVIARECLANGLLVKPASELDLARYLDSPERVEQVSQELTLLRQRAAQEGVPLSRLALDYVNELPGVSVALIGASKLDQLRSTLREAGLR